MSTKNGRLIDRIDSDDIPLMFLFGAIIFVFVVLILVSFIAAAASEDRDKDVTIACINSGGTWNEGTSDSPATCTRPTT